MFDLREHKDLIHSLVAEADKNETNWEWSVESIDQMNARIRWGYLEYCEQPNPFFVIELEDTGDGCWICTRDENGDQLTSDIVEDKDIPDLNTPIDEAIKVMFRNIVNTAHNCY